MKKINTFKNWWKIGISFFLFTGILSMSYPDLFEKKYEVKTTRSILDNPTMCAPINKFKIDFENAIAPVAPFLNPIWNHNFPITTTSPESQDFFNQGLFYLYAFNHAEAERSFKEAARLDPNCAMCYWGVALVLGPNINRPMPEEHFAETYKYSQKAFELSDAVTNKEKALILALSKRYEENPSEDRMEFDLGYANEMRFVSQRYREDLDIATLFAESLMDLVPWDYWLEDGSPKPETREAHAVLDYVLEKDPDHAGANHYYIHSVEAIHPNLAIRCADKLKELAFPSGHLIHMPSHIYVTQGMYHEASIANQEAILVDEDYIERCNAQGFYPALYYPHNLHFLWFASSMEGRSKVSIDAAKKIVTKVPREMVIKVPQLQRFYTIPLFSLVRFGKWDEILKEPKPDDAFGYTQTIWHYARGMAFAKKGNLKKATDELEKVKDGIKSEGVQSVDDPGFPTIGMSEIAAHVLQGEMEGQNNNFEKKVERLQAAVKVQDNFIYMEPPYFYYPVRQSLGAALLEANRAEEAEAVYREELEKFPKNGWSLFGLHKSLTLQNKTEEAKEIYQQFEKAWSHADIKLKSSVL
jgi:tetratricopeptide (TPR) repeat protein